MNRRAFVRAVLTSPLIAAVGLPRKYGRLGVGDVRDLGYSPAKAQVFLDGQQVHDCFLLDDIEGWVEVYKRNAEGRIYLNAARTEAVSERRYGRVQFVPNQRRRLLKA